MIHQCLLLAILSVSVFVNTFSLPVEENITPVDLKFYCISVTSNEEKVEDKVPVLLIHGVTSSHKSWNGVNLHLALNAKRKVCAVDLRNHGDSPWNKRNDVKALAADIGHFLDKQDIKKVDIIGHSLGGITAIRYALNNPDRVNSIVVEDIRPNGIMKTAIEQVVMFLNLLIEALKEVSSGATEDKARDTILGFINKKLEQLGFEERFTKESIESLELKQVDDKWSYKHNMDVIMESLKDPEKTLGESTGVYNGPALFIYGTKSPLKVGEDKDNILKLFPKAKLVPVEGAGHVIHGEFRQFVDEVVKFLNEVN